jgi:sodium-dependent phosphate cotransporter
MSFTYEEQSEIPDGKKNSAKQIALRVLFLTVIMFFFLMSLKLMSTGFKSFGKEAMHDLIKGTENPFVGLFVGLLATAIIQSSSTTTSMVVGFVGAGLLPLTHAVPVILGANIGTSVTSTIVSIGHISNKKEFRKAIAAATAHDFFNILMVAAVLPLQLLTGFLSNMALWLNDMLLAMISFGDTESSPGGFEGLDAIIKPPVHLLHDVWFNGNGYFTVPIALIILLFSLRMLSKTLKAIFIGKNKKAFEARIFGNPYKAMGWGFGLTAAVQSSSVTSSLTVPLVASGVISLRKAFPFLLGANIGTTITALIASLTDANQGAVTIALCHFLFNAIGVFFFLLIPQMRKIPIKMARKLGYWTMKNRLIGFAYILVVFFILPFILIYIS